MRNSWSAADLDEAYRLYVAGRSIAQVAIELGCTKSYVARHFREASLQMRPSGRPLSTPPPLVDPVDVVRLREAGRSFPQIATELGLPNDDMARDRYLRATGQPRRSA